VFLILAVLYSLSLKNIFYINFILRLYFSCIDKNYHIYKLIIYNIFLKVLKGVEIAGFWTRIFLRIISLFLCKLD
jgi:hypothetical protein